MTSRLDYCNGLLCGITDELLCRLQKVQNNAARVVSGSKKYDHITPVLKDLHWLPIRKRIEFKILLLTFKCMQGCAPLYLRELLVKQANTRTLRSNTKNLLQIPLTHLKRFGDRAFCAYAPRLWNELPDNIKAADSVQNFKKQLKTLLFRKEFNWLYGPWQLSNDSKALLNIIGGKGAISNINYYYYYYYYYILECYSKQILMKNISIKDGYRWVLAPVIMQSTEPTFYSCTKCIGRHDRTSNCRTVSWGHRCPHKLK